MIGTKYRKLYKEYYPIYTDTRAFVESYREQIVRFLEVSIREYEFSYKRMLDEYLARMKKPVSFLGNIKFRNIIHNQKLMEQLHRDYRVVRLGEIVEKDASLVYRLKMHDELSADEANYILQKMNRYYEESASGLMAAVILVIALAVVIVCW